LSESAEGARRGLDSITRGTFIMLLGTLGFVGESFVSRVVLAHALSFDEYGAFTFALGLAAVLTAFGTLGLPAAVARSLPYSANDDQRRWIVHTAYVVGAISVVTISLGLLFGGIILAFFAHHPLVGLTLEFFSVAVGLAIGSSILASVFQGFEDVRPNAIFVQVVNPSLFILFFLVAIATAPPPDRYLGVVVSFALAGIVTMAALLTYSRRRLPKVLPAGPRPAGLSRHLLLFAAPLLTIAALSSLAGNGDTLILGAYRGAAISTYTVALPLARLLQVGVGSLGYIFLPVASRFVRDKNDEAVRVTYATATKWVAVTSLPLFLVFFFLPGRSLALVYQPGYTSATLPLQILVLGAFLGVFVGPSAPTQVSYGQTRLLLYNSSASAVADIGLSVLLIPSLGLTGAAIAWAVGASLQPVLSTIGLAATHGVHPFRRNFWFPLLITAVPLGLLLGLFSAVLPLWSLPPIALGIVGLFVSVVLVTGSLDEGDRLLLEAVERLIGRRLRWVRRIGAWGWRIRFRQRGAP
jgi:O-antigen/teichoic acid export membrane protein